MSTDCDNELPCKKDFPIKYSKTFVEIPPGGKSVDAF